MAKVLVSLDDRLLASIDREARARGLSRSAFLSEVASRALGRRPGPGAAAEVHAALDGLVRLVEEAPRAAGEDSTDAVRAERDAR
ncbi:hypothetical protein BH20ACT9_BH20ACT9_23700 [soil metagenome]